MSWLVIASQIGAHIYDLDKKGHLKFITELHNPLGRVRNKEMKNSKPGMNRSRFKDSAPHSMTGEKNPHEEVKEQFARSLSNYLYKQFLNKSFKEINIVAEPRLLGKIKRHFSLSLMERVKWTAKDLEKVPVIRWPDILGYHRVPDNSYP